MSLPDPVPGLVIRYSYLWKAEYGRGQEEGVEDRPCAVILVSVDDGGDRVVRVLPISRTPPAVGDRQGAGTARATAARIPLNFVAKVPR